MGSKGESKRGRLQALLTGVPLVDETVWNSLAEALAPISQSYLRKLVKASGVPMSPMVEGVTQESLADLERTLVALQEEYEGSEPARKRAVRALVITAKDHARWAKGKPDKDEMLLWLMTWLENPVLFRDWVVIRNERRPPPTA